MFNSLVLEKAAYSWMTIVTTLYIINSFTQKYLSVEGFMKCWNDAKDCKGSLWLCLPFFLVMIDS